MSLTIPRADFEHLAPDHGTLRVKHDSDSCTGDSKSLKITRKDDGSIDAHCFRCGGRGWISGDGGNWRSVARTLSGDNDLGTTATEEGYLLPKDASKAPASWPKEVREWLTKAGLTFTVIEQAGIVWSEFKQQLYIPVVQETSVVGPKAVGWVLRAFNPKRYLTLAKDKAVFWGLLRGPDGHSGKGGTVVLVEDVVSALRVSEVTDALALLGVNLRPDAHQWLLRERYGEAVVFLDGDNPQVKMHARKLQRALSWMPTRIVETGRDPKSYSTQELDKLIQPRYNDPTEEEDVLSTTM